MHLDHQLDQKLERQFEDILKKYGIAYTVHPPTNGRALDFFLPDFDLYVEVKIYGCPRLLDQIESLGAQPNVLVLVGWRSVESFVKLLNHIKSHRGGENG